jgi:putative endonuclease
MLSKTQIIGQQAEEQACNYLLNQGLKIVEHNFRCNMGEIDLIMRDKDLVVFVEVRARKKNQFANGLESVNFTKQDRILRTAVYYLQKNRLTDKVACRFDVVAITLNTSSPTLCWTKDAFRP